MLLASDSAAVNLETNSPLIRCLSLCTALVIETASDAVSDLSDQ